jgi:hypothetical protein
VRLVALVALVGLVVALAAAIARSHVERGPSPRVAEAINLACVGHTGAFCARLWRLARCETAGTFDPRSVNPRPVGDENASGLFQFLPSTWRSTPYRHLSIWSPYASAMAAAWMHTHGRGGEWQCS